MRRRLLLRSGAQFLLGTALSPVLGPAWGMGSGLGADKAEVSSSSSEVTLLAAWRHEAREFIGLVGLDGRDSATWRVLRQLPVPTRAHGLWAEPDGAFLAVARRPGDWLLRWRPGLDAAGQTSEGTTQWLWVEDDRRFNGHVIASVDQGQPGRRLWTPETELEGGQGLLGVRDTATLEKTDEWPTHGRDPHQLLALPRAVGRFPAGTLMVANGGIPTLPETGRVKRLDPRLKQQRMDASLVALHPGTGELQGQWRLADPYLSIRHLAFDAGSSRLGIALQAEHPDASQRQAAPVLAVWDGRDLRPAEPLPHNQPSLQGYGGDIVAWSPARAGDPGGFAVSCVRADALVLFDAQGRWRETWRYPGAYALARLDQQIWLGGELGILRVQARATNPQTQNIAAAQADLADWYWDNHWFAINTA
ncbi:twin-arginine translocation pathway signal protein [Hylemonella gracilis str. Niagara R]|uniref:Twin-arginine translocation pathway signal protein n=1 Tax=Hylemonella gracilis str. Niagara R TaxID=1458275 RepID=A0A016XEG5_9BURK|nr:DUF1513 domain-containing protein [Hylemonella gracilis]EYC50479.1 twin-arginine translocation pathway signal protein [Hylemonella gracilis str. Niagara R]